MRLGTRLLPSAAIAIALWLATPARLAHADDARVHQLSYDIRVDVAATATGLLWLGATETLKPRLVPEKCRWCYRAADGSDTLNGLDSAIRRNLVWKDTSSAGFWSSIIAFALEPASALGLLAGASAYENAFDGFPVDALLTTEGTVAAADINQLAKFAFARERPFVHYLPRAPTGVRQLTASPSDDNLSFFSGHTTMAFAIATASGTVASLRGYRLAPAVWASGLTFATSVAYLRIAADKHYFSDVMTGVIVGSAIGAGIQLLFHTRQADDSHTGTGAAAPKAAPATATFKVSGAF